MQLHSQLTNYFWGKPTNDCNEVVRLYNATMAEPQMEILLRWPKPKLAIEDFAREQPARYHDVYECTLEHLRKAVKGVEPYTDILRPKVVIQTPPSSDSSVCTGDDDSEVEAKKFYR